MSTIPLARVNSQLEPAIDDRRRGREPDDDGGRGAVGEHAAEGDDDRLVVDAWRSLALPSTVTGPRSSAPSWAITVLSRRRSMPPPERFRALIDDPARESPVGDGEADVRRRTWR